MKIVSYKKKSAAEDGEIFAGALVASGVVPLAQFGCESVRALIEKGSSEWNSLSGEIARVPQEGRLSLSEITLVGPLPNPGKIVCVGLNYRDHAIESKMEIPSVPTVFAKYPSSVTGPDAPIVIPRMTKKADWEAELAVVIGKHAKNASEQGWEDYVFGYTILNDVSARDVQLATSQWTLGKSFDTFAPIGPCIATKDEIGDPHALNIQLSIDGVRQQNSNTRELIFRIPALIAYISSIIPLEPGDIISTGTPAGVGLGQNPQRWLRPGEEVVIEIDGIGSLRNPVVAE